MLTTEEQAKEKFCPHMRLTFGGEFGDLPKASEINRDFNVIPANGEHFAITTMTRCIASGCMMWRWHDYSWEEDGRKGRCGLAGPAEELA